MTFVQLSCALALSALLTALPALASPFRVSIDTTPLQGSAGYMAFDFVAGNPDPGNSALVSAFASDATLGLGSSSGNTNGSLVPGQLTLSGPAGFSEWLQAVTIFGNTISFDVDLGEAVSAGGRPDQFSFFLLDTTQAPYPTTDPSGAGALFYFDLTGSSTSPVIFTSDFANVSIEAVTPGGGVPEPGGLPLVLAAGVGAFLAVRGRRHLQTMAPLTAAPD